MRVLIVGTVGLLMCGFACNKKITTVTTTPPELAAPTYITAPPHINATQGPPPVLIPRAGGAVFFDFDSDVITPQAADTITRLAAGVAERGVIFVDGYCDERGSDQYNYELGMRRARAVAALLEARPAARWVVNIRSFGETGLIRSGCADEACHAENRRVEIHAE